MKTKCPKKPEAATASRAQSAAQIPDPETLLEKAKNEPRIIAARDYIETINILRHQKSFSFREIAEWLNAQGVPLDNNDVYRAYIADMNWQEKQEMEHDGKMLDPED